MSKQIFDDADLNAEHEALQHIADILAKKFKGDLDESECRYSVDGILIQFEWWTEDITAFKTLCELHRKRIEKYRADKRDKRGE